MYNSTMSESDNIAIEGDAGMPPIDVNIKRREGFYHGGKNPKWKVEGTVVMTNIRADGSETYGKSLLYYLTDPGVTGME